MARDLYVAPVALVGCGMGAAAALALAQGSPFLAGAVLAAEFALPAEVLAAAAAAGSDSACDGSGASSPGAPAPTTPVKPARKAGGVVEVAISAAASAAAGAHPTVVVQHAKVTGGQEGKHGACSSAHLLPWWGFRPGQASAFSSVEQAAAFLAHPLANLAPAQLEPLASAAAAAAAPDAPADAAAGVRPLLAALQRPLRGAVASACSLLRLPDGAAGAGGWDGAWEEAADGLLPRMDPSFHFTFDAAALAAGMASLRCHLLLLHGTSAASWVAPGDASATARAATAAGAASAAVAELPGVGHCLAADAPEALLRQVVAFLEGPAIRCFERALPGAAAGGGTRGDGRRPELLGLRPLPQYASLEEAQKVRARWGCGVNGGCWGP